MKDQDATTENRMDTGFQVGDIVCATKFTNSKGKEVWPYHGKPGIITRIEREIIWAQHSAHPAPEYPHRSHNLKRWEDTWFWEWRYWPDKQVWRFTGNQGARLTPAYPNCSIVPIGVDPNEAEDF